MRALLAVLLLPAMAGASDMYQAPVSSPGISTGAATTAALTGNGQSGNPLGVNSSSVPVFSAGRNLVLPYGLSVATVAVSDEILVGGAATVAGYGIHITNKSIIISGTGNELRFSGAQNALIGHTGAFSTQIQANGVVGLTVEPNSRFVGILDATPTQTLDVTGTYGLSDIQVLSLTSGNFVVGNPAGGGTQNVWIAANGDYRLKVQGDGGVSVPGNITTSSVTLSGGSSALKLDIVGGVFKSSTTTADNILVYAPSSQAWYFSSVHQDGNRASPGMILEGRNAGASISSQLQQEGGSGGYWNLQQGGSVRLSVKNSNGWTQFGNLANPLAKLEVLSSNSPTEYVIAASSQTATVASVWGVTGGGHVVSSGTTPSVACNAGTPAMAADSNDMSGQFTGGVASANCTVTFVNAFTKKPRCWCNDETNILVIQAISTTTTLKCTAAVAIETDVITYGCQAAP